MDITCARAFIKGEIKVILCFASAPDSDSNHKSQIINQKGASSSSLPPGLWVGGGIDGPPELLLSGSSR